MEMGEVATSISGTAGGRGDWNVRAMKISGPPGLVSIGPAMVDNGSAGFFRGAARFGLGAGAGSPVRADCAEGWFLGDALAVWRPISGERPSCLGLGLVGAADSPVALDFRLPLARRLGSDFRIGWLLRRHADQLEIIGPASVCTGV